MTSTRASPSNLDWYTTSASKLGENGVLPSLPRRAVCTCKSAGKRQNSISQVVLVEGISIPKCLGMLVIPSRSRGPCPRHERRHMGLGSCSPCQVSSPAAECATSEPGEQTTPTCVAVRPALYWGAGVCLPTLHRRRAGVQFVVPR